MMSEKAKGYIIEPNETIAIYADSPEEAMNAFIDRLLAYAANDNLGDFIRQEWSVIRVLRPALI